MKDAVLGGPRRRSFFAAALVALAGCGELSTAVDQPTHLVTVPLSAAAVSAGDVRVRVALVWRTSGDTHYAPQDDAPIADPSADVPFEVRRPPPESALHAPVLVASEGTPLRFAHGVLVAYADGNGNDRLDLDSARAEATEGDRILAANPDVIVVWLERSPSESETSILADVRGVVPLPGLNVLVLGADGPRWARSSERVDLGNPSRVGWPDRMCSFLYESPIPSAGATVYDLDRTFPAAGAQGLSCTTDSRSLSFEPCFAVGLCARSVVACTAKTRRLSASESPPTGWPCVAP